MALPKSQKERELLNLRARVAQLEEELRGFKNSSDVGNYFSAGSEKDDESRFVSGTEPPTAGPTDVQFEEGLQMAEEEIQDQYSGFDQTLSSGGQLGDETMDQTSSSASYPEKTGPNKRIKKLPCPTCGKKFAFRSELMRHINTHKPTEQREALKKLECPICGKRFHWNCDLSRHVITHGNDRPHVCTVCHAAFKLAEGLKKHMFIHADTSAKCKDCSRTYKNSVSLRTHACTRFRNNERKFICETCGKGFFRKDLLRVHLRSHTGERPYSCDVCSKGFMTSSKRKSHLATHKNKPYLCNNCNKSFTNTLALMRHLKVDEKTWNEQVSLTDVQVVTCTRGQILVQVEPIIEYPDMGDECMDTSELNGDQSELISNLPDSIQSTPNTVQLNTTSHSNSSTPSHVTLQQSLASSHFHSRCPETNTQTESSSLPQDNTLISQLTASCQSNTTTQPPDSQSSPTRTPLPPETTATPSETSATPSSPQSQAAGGSAYVQLLSRATAQDKDGHPLVQLYVQPTDDETFNFNTDIAAGMNLSDTAPPDNKDATTSSATPQDPINDHDDSGPQLEKLPDTLPAISIVTFPGQSTPPCPFCGDVCEDADSLSEHMLLHMSPKPHRCTVCKTGFDTSDEMDTHNCKEPSFDCKKCTESFTDYCTLVDHAMTNHRRSYLRLQTRTNVVGISRAKALESLMCWYCERTFPSSSQLTTHTNTTHSGSHPFRCEHCSKTFAKKHYLRAHTRNHTGEKQPHQCHHCEKNFSTTERLKIHTRSHTGERPYKCEICGQGFLRKYVLNVHLRSHTGEKPYKCNHCDRAYRVYTDCRRHIEDVHEGKRFRCEPCNKEFKRSTYKAHMRRKHSNRGDQESNSIEQNENLNPTPLDNSDVIDNDVGSSPVTYEPDEIASGDVGSDQTSGIGRVSAAAAAENPATTSVTQTSTLNNPPITQTSTLNNPPITQTSTLNNPAVTQTSTLNNPAVTQTSISENPGSTVVSSTGASTSTAGQGISMAALRATSMQLIRQKVMGGAKQLDQQPLFINIDGKLYARVT